ncbi:MAG TPA: putative LPS assembly protein LptD [Puia sp.]|nr:putative LPS assembly protein LptD [Puia sp.]
MNNARKINLKYVPASIFTALFFVITLGNPAHYSIRPIFCKILTASCDTVKPNSQASRDTSIKDTVIKDGLLKDTSAKDTAGERKDTLSYKISKDSLEAPISYSAADSVVLDIPTKNITLYNKANAKYKDLTLDAYKIQLDQPSQIVIATYTMDTANQMVGKPKMVQGESTMESDSIVYNLKNQKGITRNTWTKSGEMYVMGEKMKKISPTEFYAWRGRFTTCNLDTPHFAFRAKKLILINKKMAITGPIHPEFEGVPVPIYLPFGFFPISEGRHSGILPPAFNASPQFGLGIEGLGYYKVFSDNFDAIFRANLYSYGGWNLYLTPEYKVRYRYSGRMNLAYQLTRTLDNTGKQTYDDVKTYSVNWSHTVDSKARPGTNFGANVNFMSTKYNQNVYNNPTINFTNQISSSITYSKTWNGKLNLTVSGNHSQNNETKLISINLPNIGFTATTIYPFQKKEFIGTPKWYEKLGIGLTSSISSGTSFYDSLFSFKNLIDTFQWGASHSIPITLALPQLGPLQIAPGMSLQEKWFSKKYLYKWDPTTNMVDVSQQKGFYVANNVSFSLNFSTAIFGTFTNFGKSSSVLGIRHVMRPTIGLNYTPDLNSKYYMNVQVDTFGHYQNFSNFTGGFSPGTFGGLSFGLDNNLEMKVRNKGDTSAGAFKKVKLIDGFGFTGSYNYLADSFKLSPISFYIRSTLFQNINITGGATLDPYITDSFGYRRNIYAWDAPGKKFSIGRLTSANLAISTSFKSKPKDEKKAEAEKQAASDQLPMTVDEQEAQLDYIKAHPAEFADFNVNWELNLSYSLNFSNVFEIRQGFSGYKTTVTSSIIFNGNFNLTEKWKLGANGYFDVINLKLNSLTGYLSRDMHCWQLSINVTPVGPWRSFSITLNPKAAILRDLRINRARSFQD